MSVFSSQQIRQAVTSDRIICYPFIEQRISGSSLDVTLGYYYYRAEQSNNRTLYNPFDHEDVERYYDGPYRALPHSEWCQLNGLKAVVGIPESHPVIAIRPGERILAHTHEFVGIVPPDACEVRGRSSWSRSGIVVCSGGDWIHPGDIGRITLEIRNTNEHETVLLPVGEPIVQVIFHEIGGADSTELTHPNLEAIIKTWSPGRMLPYAYRTRRTLPPDIEGLSYD